jgi:hypothetical protein
MLGTNSDIFFYLVVIISNVFVIDKSSATRGRINARQDVTIEIENENEIKTIKFNQNI